MSAENWTVHRHFFCPTLCRAFVDVIRADYYKNRTIIKLALFITRLVNRHNLRKFKRVREFWYFLFAYQNLEDSPLFCLIFCFVSFFFSFEVIGINTHNQTSIHEYRWPWLPATSAPPSHSPGFAWVLLFSSAPSHVSR